MGALGELADDVIGPALPGAAGRNKEALTHLRDPDKLILRARRPGDASLTALQEEAALLQRIRTAGFNTPQIFEVTLARGNPALVVEKVEGIFSKKIIDRSGRGRPRVKSERVHREIHRNPRLLEALRELRSKLEVQGIDDLQFLMQDTGRIVIIDPRGFGPVVIANRDLLDALLKPPGRPRPRTRGGSKKGRFDEG